MVPPTSYPRSQRACLEFGAALLVPESLEEIAFITQKLPDLVFWIGLNDLKEEGKNFAFG